MQDIKQNLANAVREARTELGLSQEKLAEILNLDQRTILNIEAGRGNPKFEKLYPLITYLKIPADKIFCKVSFLEYNELYSLRSLSISRVLGFIPRRFNIFSAPSWSRSSVS